MMDRSLNYGALGGAISVILVWILGLLGLVVPPEVAGAIAVVCTTLVAALVPNKSTPQ